MGCICFFGKEVSCTRRRYLLLRSDVQVPWRASAFKDFNACNFITGSRLVDIIDSKFEIILPTTSMGDLFGLRVIF